MRKFPTFWKTIFSAECIVESSSPFTYYDNAMLHNLLALVLFSLELLTITDCILYCYVIALPAFVVLILTLKATGFLILLHTHYKNQVTKRLFSRWREEIREWCHSHHFFDSSISFGNDTKWQWPFYEVNGK